MKHWINKLIVASALLFSLGVATLAPNSLVYAADDKATPVAAASAAPAAAEAPAVPVPNKGDTAWLLVCTALVIMMTVPALGLFYGGLVRKKNMLSVLMQCLVVFSLIMVLWAIYGYSIAFTEGNAFFGGFDRLFLAGITPESVAATFSKGVYVPELAYMVFQAAFAAIKTKSKYAQVSKILGQDAYAYVKAFMDTSTKYHKQSIDTSYKALT